MERGAAALQDLTAPVRAELERVRVELARDLRPEERDLDPLVEQADSYRGKQLRPALVLLSGRAVGRVGSAHIEVAKIVELLHTATLVHDDVLDDAGMRRKKPTVNALYGAEVPVLLGDYLYARAFHMSVQLDDPTCSRVLAEVTRRICQGEITQILHRFDFDWSEERYFRVICDKTALLYGASCRLGGHYAGGTPAQLDALDRFGTDLGVAFQIVDDCLDLDGDEAVVGKSLGTDLVKGKLTLPLLYLLREPTGRARLRALMQAEQGGAEKLRRLHAEFDLNTALAEARRAAQARLDRATSALAGLPPSAARDTMESLASYVLDRQR